MFGGSREILDPQKILFSRMDDRGNLDLNKESAHYECSYYLENTITSIFSSSHTACIFDGHYSNAILHYAVCVTEVASLRLPCLSNAYCSQICLQKQNIKKVTTFNESA